MSKERRNKTTEASGVAVAHNRLEEPNHFIMGRVKLTTRSILQGILTRTLAAIPVYLPNFSKKQPTG
ncbi:MAG: hypothetical protein ACR2MF_05130 [Chthoniobacterales bacterium]